MWDFKKAKNGVRVTNDLNTEMQSKNKIEDLYESNQSIDDNSIKVSSLEFAQCILLSMK